MTFPNAGPAENLEFPPANRVSAGQAGEGSPPLAGEEPELAEEVHLVEEQMLRLQRAALGDVHRCPPERQGSSCRRDIAVGRVEHTIMGARHVPSAAAAGPSLRSWLISGAGPGTLLGTRR